MYEIWSIYPSNKNFSKNYQNGRKFYIYLKYSKLLTFEGPYIKVIYNIC